MNASTLNPVAFFLTRTSTLLGRRMLSDTVNITDGIVINVILDPMVAMAQNLTKKITAL